MSYPPEYRRQVVELYRAGLMACSRRMKEPRRPLGRSGLVLFNHATGDCYFFLPWCWGTVTQHCRPQITAYRDVVREQYRLAERDVAGKLMFLRAGVVGDVV